VAGRHGWTVRDIAAAVDENPLHEFTPERR
jgi:hypothetical protein